MTNQIEIVTMGREDRAIARVLDFGARQADHINWNSIGRLARELGADFEARRAADGGIVVTIFWVHANETTTG